MTRPACQEGALAQELVHHRSIQTGSTGYLVCWLRMHAINACFKIIDNVAGKASWLLDHQTTRMVDPQIVDVAASVQTSN